MNTKPSDLPLFYASRLRRYIAAKSSEISCWEEEAAHEAALISGFYNWTAPIFYSGSRRCSRADVRLALLCHDGDFKEAARIMGVPKSTLRGWANV